MIDHILAITLDSRTAAPILRQKQTWISIVQETSLPERLAAIDFGTTAPRKVELTSPSPNPIEALQTLRRLAMLRHGWDGDRAKAPGPSAISNAGLASVQLEERHLSYTIAADVDGGVILTLRHRTFENRFAALSCDNDGDVYLILEAPPALPLVRQVTGTEALDLLTLDEISEFLTRSA